MVELWIAIGTLVVSGLAFLAYNHFEAYRTLSGKMVNLLLFLVVTSCSWGSGARHAKEAMQYPIPDPNQLGVKSVESDLLIAKWIALGSVFAAIFLVLLFLIGVWLGRGKFEKLERDG